MNNDKKLYLFATLASIGVLATGLVVSNASGVEAFTNLFRNNKQNNWTITQTDLDSDQDTFTKLTRNGNPVVFNKNNTSVSNVDPITGLLSVSFTSSNSVIKISTGFKEDKFLYERYIENDGSNEFNVSLYGERYINLSSLNEELAIDEVNIEYSCSGLEEEIYDSNLTFQYNEGTESYSVGTPSTTIAKTMKRVLVPRYFDDGVNGEHFVTAVASSGFNACTATEIYLPSTITKIESQGFYQCKKVKSIYLPDSITSLGSSSFNACSVLKHIRLSESLTKIDDRCFYECSALESIHLPDSVSSLGSSEFTRDSLLSEVNCPRSLKTIGNSTFYIMDSLKSFTVTSNVTSIALRAFKSCPALEEVTYEGTISDFNKIADSKWYEATTCPKLSVVHCLDGDITL